MIEKIEKYELMMVVHPGSPESAYKAVKAYIEGGIKFIISSLMKKV